MIEKETELIIAENKMLDEEERFYTEKCRRGFEELERFCFSLFFCVTEYFEIH